MKFLILILVVFASYYYISCKVEVAPEQRVIVLKLSKFERVLATGTHFTLPFVEQAVWFDLDKQLPNWKTLSEQEINQQIKTLFFVEPSKYY